MSKPETLEKKYVGKLGKEALDLMNKLLIMDPKDRCTAKEAMFHTFFDGVRSPADDKLC